MILVFSMAFPVLSIIIIFFTIAILYFYMLLELENEIVSCNMTSKIERSKDFI